MRHFNGRQVRKTLAFSKTLAMHRAAAAWEDACYNLVHQYKSSRLEVADAADRRWIPRTPMMAAG